MWPKYTSQEVKEKFLDKGIKITPAGLYEPDHAPKGTKFFIWKDRGLYRVRG
jgi:hypothetical protein